MTKRKAPSSDELKAQIETLKKQLIVQEAVEKEKRDQEARALRGQRLALMGLALAAMLAEAQDEEAKTLGKAAYAAFSSTHLLPDAPKKRIKAEKDLAILKDAIVLGINGELK